MQWLWLRIFAIAGRIVRGSRRLRLRLARHWPWATRSPSRSPACTLSRLTSRTIPATKKDNHQGPWNPPTWRERRAARHGQMLKTTAAQCLKPPTQDHERLRLMRRQLTLHRRREGMVTMSAWRRQQPEASQDGESQERLDIQVTEVISQSFS
jgi:hypothetical protein